MMDTLKAQLPPVTEACDRCGRRLQRWDYRRLWCPHCWGRSVTEQRARVAVRERGRL
jgi:hypothetical protein